MTRIFISYAHKDEDLKKELEKHLSELERQGIVTTWSDEQIRPGEELDSAIQKKLERADIILLLVSPDFLTSTYCREVETVKALEQRHTRGSITIPVILRPCDWHRAPFGRRKALPKDGKPVVKYPSRDDAFLEIAKALGSEAEAYNNKARLSVDSDSVWSNMFSHPAFPTELVDQKIKEETEILRKSRFFVEFDRTQFSLALARKLEEGELSVGSDSVRSESLAWCVRLLCTEKLDKAEKYLKLAKELGTGPEIDIADAFISSQRGDMQIALNILARIDSPLSRSAALIIIGHHDGLQAAIDWLKAVGINASGLDPDGRHFLLEYQLELADWKAAQKSLDVLTDEDLRDAPILHHRVAIAHLLKAVPDEFRSLVLDQPPFQAIDFPLAADLAALKARRIAHHHFVDATNVACQLNLPREAAIADEYALWLELMDPGESDKGRERLKSKLHDLKTNLSLVRLGLQFGIKLDLTAVEREIKRQIALSGGLTLEAAIAHLALAVTQLTPEEAANYIVRYQDELAKYIDKEVMLSLQIEMLSKAGQPDRANGILDTLIGDGLSEAKKIRLQGMIAKAEGTNPVEALKNQFNKTDSLVDLKNLVNELGAREDLEGLCEYREILFEKTRALPDAEIFASVLHDTQKNERLVEFLESNKTFLDQSEKLQMLYCLSLYHEGELLKARNELKKLNDDWDDPSYRALQRTLQIDLATSLGNWSSLSEFVSKECNEKDKRNARELIQAAQLALRLDFPYVKELTFAAVKKGKDDANVLASAYFLASSAGWEDDSQVSQWIQKAAQLSGEDGPLQRRTLKDMVDQKPEWDRREFEIWQMLSRGETPMFIAAQDLNKSLIDLMLFPALANLSERDPRRRGIIPAYSGQRQPLSLDTSRQIGMDVTVLLTLSFLDLLDEALDTFDKVHIPHSTLNWLLNEKQRVAFHQPSRIKDARQIRDLLATGDLEKFSPSTGSDSELSEQVGEELALFIAEAEKGRGEDDLQHIVVRPSPVYRVSSLMEEEADLTAHVAVLSSCQSIVDKLRQKGRIRASEAQKARSYLQLHEKLWPNQPEIADGAVLYLDDLAVNYFLHLGILEKLRAAGFRPIISPTTELETNQLISYESISGKAKDAIERIRSAVNSRIESEKIKVGRLINTDHSIARSISEHPTAGVHDLAKYCDAIITDDRFFNKGSNCDNNGILTPIFTTLDLIDALVSADSITSEERLEYRTQLRQAGYVFVPVSEDELAHHLAASTVKNGKIVETAELKAIRENILRVRMTTWLQIPNEVPWLNTLIQVFSRVLKDLWKGDIDFSSTRTRSNWIMTQIDMRGWAHRFGKESGDDIVKTRRGAYILLLITSLVDVSREVQDEYWDWVEERILSPIKEQYPDLYSWIVEWQQKHISKMADMDITKERTK